MDDVDKALLDELQRDADRSLFDLGAAVGLSASAVQRRISRLKKEGTIRGIVAIVEPSKVGLPITIVTTVRLERDGTDISQPLIDKLSARPEVVLLHSLAGQHDLLVVTVVGDLDDYATGVLAELESDSNVSRLETNVSLGTYKWTHQLPTGHQPAG